MAISADSKLITLGNLREFKSKLDTYIEENKAVTFNYSFEVDDDGNLVVVYSDDESAPTGFSIDDDGYLIYTS